mmetsp:Transcript_7456/g.21751  ORF Transcript_7456/g.21751 Transcript_7456/m.21751 type:complete len:201 (-) Transcript_7456:22-624(-)
MGRLKKRTFSRIPKILSVLDRALQICVVLRCVLFVCPCAGSTETTIVILQCFGGLWIVVGTRGRIGEPRNAFRRLPHQARKEVRWIRQRNESPGLGNNESPVLSNGCLHPGSDRIGGLPREGHFFSAVIQKKNGQRASCICIGSCIGSCIDSCITIHDVRFQNFARRHLHSDAVRDKVSGEFVHRVALENVAPRHGRRRR